MAGKAQIIRITIFGYQQWRRQRGRLNKRLQKLLGIHSNIRIRFSRVNLPKTLSVVAFLVLRYVSNKIRILTQLLF